MYIIGYDKDPITRKGSMELLITTDYIDFNTYKPEQIFYIDRIIQPQVKSRIKIFHAGFGDDANTLINFTTSLISEKPDLYGEPLTLYDKMLIWMFNNPDRAQYDKEMETEFFNTKKHK